MKLKIILKIFYELLKIIFELALGKSNFFNFILCYLTFYKKILYLFFLKSIVESIN